MNAHTVLMDTGFSGKFREIQNEAYVFHAKSYDFTVDAARPFLM